MISAFGVEHRDVVAKLGPPKGRFQEYGVHEQEGNTITVHPADEVTAHYKGKSMILRRPKYQVVAAPRSMKNKRSKGNMTVTASQNVKMKREYAERVHQAYQGKKRKIDIDGQKVKFAIGKSVFGVEHGEISKGLPSALRSGRAASHYGQHLQAAKTYGSDHARMLHTINDERVLAQGMNQKAKARRITLKNSNSKKKRVLP